MTVHRRTYFRNEGERGSTMIEAALALLVFVLLLFGIMDLGRMVWAYNMVAFSTQEAVRYAIANGSSSPAPATQQTISNLVVAKMGGLGAQTTATASWNPDNNPGSWVNITVTYSFRPVAPYLPSAGWPLRSRSQGMISR